MRITREYSTNGMEVLGSGFFALRNLRSGVLASTHAFYGALEIVSEYVTLFFSF